VEKPNQILHKPEKKESKIKFSILNQSGKDIERLQFKFFLSKWPFCISELRVLTIAKSLKLKQLGLTEKKVCTKL
jgi:hypothetical protein